MNPGILADVLPTIADLHERMHQQIPDQEALLESLSEAKAMLDVLLSSNLTHSQLTLHHYLWLLNNIIRQAEVLSERLLNNLLAVNVLRGTSNPVVDPPL